MDCRKLQTHVIECVFRFGFYDHIRVATISWRRSMLDLVADSFCSFALHVKLIDSNPQDKTG